jgi:L-ascorbate metabolism protein UlaG (beta-lactamase superfamily)
MKAADTRSTITWWGVANIEIHLNGLDLGFDPYLYPREPRLEYIFITHEHYDHFYEPTLTFLAESPRLKILVVPKPCYFASQLNSPTMEDPKPSDLEWSDRHRTMVFYPRVAPAGVRYDGPSEARIGRLHVLGVASGENPEEWADFTPLETPFPTVGYVVTDEETGLSFYHPGDIEYVFDELAQLQNKVTHLFLPIGKLNGEEAQMVKLVQPRYIIPVHYRLDTADWPIPLNVREDEIRYASWITGHPLSGVSWHSADYLADVSKLIKGHWYPTPRDPKSFLKSLKSEIGNTAEILMLHAGREYSLDPNTGAIEGAVLVE